MKRNPRQRPEQPKAIAIAVYAAANRGRYSLVRNRTDAALRRRLTKVHDQAAATDKYIRNILSKTKGRRGNDAVKARKTLRALTKASRLFMTLRLGSPKFDREVWNGLTRGRSLARIEATRQIVRGRRAKVYLRLTLRNGTVIRETEELVCRSGRWYLG